MALINCPECGKTGVSDSAMACPACGYGIKEYFEIISEIDKKEDVDDHFSEIEDDLASAILWNLSDNVEKIEKDKLSKEKWCKVKQNETVEQKMSKEVTVNNLKKEIQESMTSLKKLVIMCVAFLFFLIIDSRLLLISFPGFIYVGLGFIVHTVVIVSSKNDLKMVEDNFENYKEVLKRREIIDKEQKEYERQMAEKKKQRKEAALNAKNRNINHQLRCPYCGSSAVTTGARGIDWFWGPIGASSTINRCGSCGGSWKPRKR